MQYSCVFSHVSGIVKAFQDQSVLPLINSLRFDLCRHAGGKTVAVSGRAAGSQTQQLPRAPDACGAGGAGEGSGAARATAASPGPLFPRAANLPPPTRPCRLPGLRSTSPELGRGRLLPRCHSSGRQSLKLHLATAGATQVVSVCLDPQRFRMRSGGTRHLNEYF